MTMAMKKASKRRLSADQRPPPEHRVGARVHVWLRARYPATVRERVGDAYHVELADGRRFEVPAVNVSPWRCPAPEPGDREPALPHDWWRRIDEMAARVLDPGTPRAAALRVLVALGLEWFRGHAPTMSRGELAMRIGELAASDGPLRRAERSRGITVSVYLDAKTAKRVGVPARKRAKRWTFSLDELRQLATDGTVPERVNAWESATWPISVSRWIVVNRRGIFMRRRGGLTAHADDPPRVAQR